MNKKYGFKLLFPASLYQEYKDVFSNFKESINKNTQVIISLSGGVDSTVLLFFCLAYFKNQGLHTGKITVLHYNHKQRKESEVEEKELTSFLTSIGIRIIGSSYNSFYGLSENNLRKGRKQFFDSLISYYLNQKKDVVFLSGHHLDDRIETTILNKERGAGERGVRNMSTFKRSYISDIKGNILQYVYFRPLINLSKKEIYSIGAKHFVSYFEDITNKDESISLRNKIRNENNILLSPEYYFKRRSFYATYDSKHNFEELTCEKLSNFHPSIQQYYKVNNMVNICQFQNLLDFLGIYIGISRNFLLEMERFLQKKKGYKYFKGRYFFNSHGDFYAIKAKKMFRDEKFVFPLDKKFSKSTIRANIKGDTYHGKRFRKFLINQKIPFFIRNYIPVEIVGGKILNTLSRKDLKNSRIL